MAPAELDDSVTAIDSNLRAGVLSMAIQALGTRGDDAAPVGPAEARRRIDHNAMLAA
jgi:hypothetical protein